MALKDWKKVENFYKYATVWGSKDTLNLFHLQLINANKMFKKEAVSPFIVQLTGYLNQLIWSKSFKTKKQALAFAKNYMRTH